MIILTRNTSKSGERCLVCARKKDLEKHVIRFSTYSGPKWSPKCILGDRKIRGDRKTLTFVFDHIAVRPYRVGIYWVRIFTQGNTLEQYAEYFVRITLLNSIFSSFFVFLHLSSLSLIKTHRINENMLSKTVIRTKCSAYYSSVFVEIRTQ